jgi:hypothetical protein
MTVRSPSMVNDPADPSTCLDRKVMVGCWAMWRTSPRVLVICARSASVSGLTPRALSRMRRLSKPFQASLAPVDLTLEVVTAAVVEAECSALRLVRSRTCGRGGLVAFAEPSILKQRRLPRLKSTGDVASSRQSATVNWLSR